MSESYKALRVPVALLQQKVYSYGQRLPAWTGILLDDKGKTVVSDASRVTSPSAALLVVARKVEPDSNLFTNTPWLRRFFFLVDDKERVTCRSCFEIATTGEERKKHTICYKPIARTLALMVKDGACAICEQNLDPVAVDKDFNGVPVCSESCLFIWDRMPPDSFDFEMAAVKAELAAEAEPKKGISYGL